MTRPPAEITEALREALNRAIDAYNNDPHAFDHETAMDLAVNAFLAAAPAPASSDETTPAWDDTDCEHAADCMCIEPDHARCCGAYRKHFMEAQARAASASVPPLDAKILAVALRTDPGIEAVFEDVDEAAADIAYRYDDVIRRLAAETPEQDRP